MEKDNVIAKLYADIGYLKAEREELKEGCMSVRGG